MQDFDEVVALVDLDDLADDGEVVLTYPGGGDPPSAPVVAPEGLSSRPVQAAVVSMEPSNTPLSSSPLAPTPTFTAPPQPAPEPAPASPSAAASPASARITSYAAGLPTEASGDMMLLAVELEACELTPEGGQVQVACGDVTGLGVELGVQLGLADVKFQVFDPDFEEWCTPTSLDEMGGSVRVLITGGTRTGAASPGSRPAEAALTPREAAAALGEDEHSLVASQQAEMQALQQQLAAVEASTESPGVRELMSMGFSRTSSRSALEASRGEVQVAAEMLLENPEQGTVEPAAPTRPPPPLEWVGYSTVSGGPPAEAITPQSMRAGRGSRGAGRRAEPEPSLNPADLINGEASSRGIPPARLTAMLQELQAVTSVSLSEAQELLLAANLDLNRAVEHFFTSDRAESGQGNSGGGGAGRSGGDGGGGFASQAPQPASPATAYSGGAHSSDSWAVQEADQLGLFADGSIETPEELAAKKQLVDKMQAYKASNPIAETLPIFDVVQFAWERMSECTEPAEIHRQYQAQARNAASIRMSMSLGFQSVAADMDRFKAMQAQEVSRVASHIGTLDHEQKNKAGIKKWKTRWFALWQSPAEDDMVLLCYESAHAPAPLGLARLVRGGYSVQPPKQPRRGHPFCFRISIDQADGKSGKYILCASSQEAMDGWVEALQPPAARSRAEAKRELLAVQQKAAKALTILRNSFQVNGVRKTLSVTGAKVITPTAFKHGWLRREDKQRKGHWRRCFCVLWRLPTALAQDPFFLLYYPDRAAHKPDGFLTLGPGQYRVAPQPARKDFEFVMRIDSSAQDGAEKLLLCSEARQEHQAWLEVLHALFGGPATGAMPNSAPFVLCCLLIWSSCQFLSVQT